MISVEQLRIVGKSTIGLRVELPDSPPLAMMGEPQVS